MNKVVGTAIYAALNAHNPSAKYYKKDDLESLMYILSYFAKGTLPWKHCKSNSDGLGEMKEIKENTQACDLFNKMPLEFNEMYEYIMGLSES